MPPLKTLKLSKPQQQRIAAVYRQCGTIPSNTGGALDGELTRGSMHSVLASLKLRADSVLLDAGAGAGKPCLHAAAMGHRAVGVELERPRWMLSLANKAGCERAWRGGGGGGGGGGTAAAAASFVLGDVTEFATLEPCTHVYAFDVGFPPGVREALVQAAYRSASVVRLALVTNRPLRRDDPRFEEVGAVKVHMSGGNNEGKTARIYEKRGASGGASADADAPAVRRANAEAALAKLMAMAKAKAPPSAWTKKREDVKVQQQRILDDALSPGTRLRAVPFAPDEARKLYKRPLRAQAFHYHPGGRGSPAVGRLAVLRATDEPGLRSKLRGKGNLVVERVEVFEPHRGQGHCAPMMAELLALPSLRLRYADANDPERVYLDAQKDNAAATKCYRSALFEPVPELNGGGGGDDLVYMRARLRCRSVADALATADADADDAMRQWKAATGPTTRTRRMQR